MCRSIPVIFIRPRPGLPGPSDPRRSLGRDRLVAVVTHEDLSLGMLGDPLTPGDVLGVTSLRELGTLGRAADADQFLALGKPEAPGRAVVQEGLAVIGRFRRAVGIAGGAEGHVAAVEGPGIEMGFVPRPVED